MNEFTAKKLGEVLAFSRIGIDTIERGREALVSVSSEDNVQSALDELTSHAERIESLTELKDVTMAKAEATGKKLTAMRDMYVGDEWDNPAELLEWSGFFEGAAVVHWALVLGAGETLKNEDLIDLADDAKDFHEDELANSSELLHSIGGTKAQSA